MDRQLTGDTWRATVSPRGTLTGMEVLLDGGWRRIDFRDDAHAGPQWYGEWDGQEHQVELQPEAGGASFTGLHDGLRWELAYQARPGHLAVTAGVRNERAEVFRPAKAGLTPGLHWVKA